MTKVGKLKLAILLGRRDAPTDGVRDYCARLVSSLQGRGIAVSVFEAPGLASSLRGGLSAIRRVNNTGESSCVFVQYTHFTWPWRGFPVGFLGLVLYLKVIGCQVVTVFHDPDLSRGRRKRDVTRRLVQVAVMKRAARFADAVVSTVDPSRVPWMRDPRIWSKTRLIPVGSNVAGRVAGVAVAGEELLTVVVFGVTEGSRSEAALIARVVGRASEAAGGLRLIVMGRGAASVGQVLRDELIGTTVSLEVYDLLPAERVGELFALSHVQLFVRGGLSSKRTSAIAGITYGLPIVGYWGNETAFPVTEAGVRLVPIGDVEGLARELVSVLTDRDLRLALSARSRQAADQYFDWDEIAKKYVELVRTIDSKREAYSNA